MTKGYLCLVLHAHLPFVRHPEFDDFLEELWFYEAITETYIPLIKVFEGLLRDGVDFRLTMSLTPTLTAMFQDPVLQGRYFRHIEKLIQLAEKEVGRNSNSFEFSSLSRMYLKHFCDCRNIFEKYSRNLVTAFKNFQDAGKLEIITCAATHSYFPLMQTNTASKSAQIKVGVQSYKNCFSRKPLGIWLPECGYNPQDDIILKEEGIKYFFSDSHGILHATPRPKYGVFAPVYCSNSGVACFARDLETAKQVWSSKDGYPGDYYYREFYKDIGFDLDFDYIKPYIHPDGIRINTGIKYYRITGVDNKQPYVPELAREKAVEHAGNFMFNRQRQVEYLFDVMKKKPIIISSYDAELFGHWWYEGPQWIDFLIRKIHFDQDMIKMITPFEYLKKNPINQAVNVSMSSWGWKGYNEMWLQGANDWTYRHLDQAAEKMSELVKTNPHAEGVRKRLLNQALRELLLAQSSDWSFIMGTGTHVNYAISRIKEHVINFNCLYQDIVSNQVDEKRLNSLELRNNIFPDINYTAHS